VKIVTTYIYPPIPDRSFDWQASSYDYDEGGPIGHGKTEQDAIADLLEQMSATNSGTAARKESSNG
jgi:hypothetical protein